MCDNFSESLDRQLAAYESMGRRPKTAATDRAKSFGGWKKFAAATGASLVSATSADAAITHVIPQTPIRVDIYETNVAGVNVDGIGGNELEIGIGVTLETFPYNGYRFIGSAYGLGNATLIGGEFAGPYGYAGIRRFNSNDSIPAVTPMTAGYVLRVSTSSFGNIAASAGKWSFDDTGLAGFVMGPAESKRAGWIKIRTESFFDGSIDRLGIVEVLEWAYESVPGVSILAGQTTSGGVPGDYDNNGTVGPEDYALWKSTFNNNVAAGAGADGNSSGKVDAADYTVWRDNLAGAGSGAAAAIPEPASVTLGVLALGAAGVAALRRRES